MHFKEKTAEKIKRKEKCSTAGTVIVGCIFWKKQIVLSYAVWARGRARNWCSMWIFKQYNSMQKNVFIRTQTEPQSELKLAQFGREDEMTSRLNDFY